jgi:hypothetical protein
MLLTSVAGNDVDEWTSEFNKGIVHEWAWACPKCNKEQLFTWFKKLEDGTKVGLVWDDIQVEGRTNIIASSKTARMVCQHCKGVFDNNPINRRALNDSGRYVVTKADGDNKIHSFRWSALANIDVGYDVLATEYLEAKGTLAWEGDKTKLADFYRMKLAVPWQTKHAVSIQDVLTENYNPTEDWGDFTFMSVDCQANFAEFWYVIRAWKKTGESRLKAWGRAPDFVSLRKIQVDNKIRDNNVLIDSGYNATTIYSKCCEYSHVGIIRGKKIVLGWQALKGADATDFPHSDNTRKLYAPEVRGDPNLGKGAKGQTCSLFRWSSPSIQDILTYLRDGKGVSFVIPESLQSEEYTRQMNSHYKTFILDKKTNKPKPTYIQRTGVDDHIWDCESMNVVAAYMSGCLGSAVIAK